MRQILCKVLFAVLIFMMCLPLEVRADSGRQIDNFDGHDDGGNVSEDAEEKESRVTMSDGSEYDTETGYFYYTVENTTFGLTVLDGSMVTDSVSVKGDAALTLKLYRGSTEVTDWDGSTVSAAGKYIISATENESTQAKRVQFTIVPAVTGMVKEYELPQDYFVVSATCDGENAPHTQAYVDLSEEGSYEILYSCPLTGQSGSLKFTIDNTAPELEITGVDEETHKAHSAVTVSSPEADVKIYMKRNDEEITTTETLTETGVYTVTARDEAGNENVYEFVIVAYMNSNSWLLLEALGALVLAVLGYGLYSRKYLRVR